MPPQAKAKFSEGSNQRRNCRGHQVSVPPANYQPKIVCPCHVFIFCITLVHLEIPQAFLFSPQIPGSGLLKAVSSVPRQGSGKFRTKSSDDTEMHQPNRVPCSAGSHPLGARSWVFVRCCLANLTRASQRPSPPPTDITDGFHRYKGLRWTCP